MNKKEQTIIKIHKRESENRNNFQENLKEGTFKNYKFQSEMFKNLSDCNLFKYRAYNNSEYYGQLNDSDNRDGLGIVIYSNGRTYEGKWRNNYKEGYGFEKYENGNIYEGEYKGGKQNGKGIFLWKSGDKFEGDWMNGKKHGQGIWASKDGDSYIGEWKNGKPDGFGIYVWKNGNKYEGSFKAGIKNGKGSEYYSNGDIYHGDFWMGNCEGEGKYIWKNGETYEGNFKSNFKHGFGKWKNLSEKNPCNYEGNYYQDKRNGYGEFKWSSGNSFKGMFKDNERHGIGEMLRNDGLKYLGFWIHGIQNGFGRLFYKDKLIKEGIFIKNVFYPEVPYEIPVELKSLNYNIENLKEKENKIYSRQNPLKIYQNVPQYLKTFETIDNSEIKFLLKKLNSTDNTQNILSNEKNLLNNYDKKSKDLKLNNKYKIMNTLSHRHYQDNNQNILGKITNNHLKEKSPSLNTDKMYQRAQFRLETMKKSIARITHNY